MRIPHWLIPVIAVVAGLAIGVAAAFIGGRLNAPQAESAPGQISVPILGPTSVNGVSTSALVDPDGISVSPGIGTGLVADPDSGAVGVVDATEQAEIDALDRADGVDTGDAESALASAEPDASSTADDPCSPADGSAPADDCPDGLHSAIFADTLPPALTAWVYFRPPVSSDDGWAFCPATPDSTTDLPIGFATSVPGDVAVTYWPISDPTDVRSVDFPGDPDDATTWTANAALGSYPAPYTLYQHCGVIPDLAPGTAYTMSYIAHDVIDRRTDAQFRDFSIDGAPTMPPLNVIALGNDLLYVSAPAAGIDRPPLVRAWVPAAGEPTDCSGLDTADFVLPSVRSFDFFPVTTEYNRLHNYDNSWNYRYSGVLSAPEGSTIVVCARWFPTAGPSWSRGTPDRQSTIIVNSPDFATPVVTLKQVALVKDVAESALKLQVTSQAGLECGAQAYLPAIHAGGPVAFDTELCSARGTHYADYEQDRFGLGGNLRVTSLLDTTSSEVSSSYLLPLSRYTRCAGADCPLPPTLEYSIPLPSVRTGTGLCGGFGDCTPPSTENAVGSALIQVTWERGATNGHSNWSVGAPDTSLPDAPRPEAPQLDLIQSVQLTPSADGFTSMAVLPIHTDRHVSYRLTVAGECFGTTTAITEVVGETPTAAPYDTSARIGPLCAGSTYELTLVLTDDEGHTVTYRSSGYRDYWSALQVRVPIENMTITGTVTVTNVNSTRDTRPWGVIGSQVTVGSDSTNFHPATESEDACHPGTDLGTDGSFPTFTAVRTQEIDLHLYTALVREALYYGHDYDATCGWPSPSWISASIDSVVTWDQLSHGVTIQGDLYPDWSRTDSEFHVVYHLQATRG